MKILIVMGGLSTEREVSIATGESVYEAIKDLAEYEVDCLYLDNSNVLEILSKKPDLVFLALHGKGGEDGTIQGFLDLFGIPYTGSGLNASAICMDKYITKLLFKEFGVLTPDFITIRHDEVIKPDGVKSIVDRIGFPAVVKASRQGSSVGVEIVNDVDKLIDTITRERLLGDDIVVEKYISGVEVTAPVINLNGEATVLPIIEITSNNDFYDYECKYTPGMCNHIIPARISKEVENKIKEASLIVYEMFDLSGVARVDYIIDSNMDPYALEINTLPGMTKTSLVPDSAKAAGIEFTRLISLIIEDAMTNFKKKNNIR